MSTGALPLHEGKQLRNQYLKRLSREKLDRETRLHPQGGNLKINHARDHFGAPQEQCFLRQESGEVPVLGTSAFLDALPKESCKPFEKTAQPSSHIAHLNGLRALAFLGVLIFHFRHGCQGGFLGVDVFFVLSGYLMTRSIGMQIERQQFCYMSFLRRRFWRLYPALLCTMMMTLVCSYAFFSPEIVLQIAKSVEASTAAVSNILYMTEDDYFGTSSALKPLLHTWSLSVEWQFYLLWPVIMVLSSRSRFFEKVRPFWPLTALCAASFVHGLQTGASMPQAAFFLLPGRAFEFGLGALLLTAPVVTNPRLGNLMSLCGTSMILLSFTYLNATHGAPALIALPALFGALLVIASPSTVASNWLYNSAPLDYLGKISYSAYLVHWPVFVFFHNIYEHTQAPRVIEATVVVLMMAVSALMFHCVEDEFRIGKKWWHKVVGVSLVACVLLAARHATATKGWRTRLTASSRVGAPKAESQWFYVEEARNIYKPRQKTFPGGSSEVDFGMVPSDSGRSIANKDKFDGVLVGDSFAGPFAGALKAIANEHSMNFLVLSHFSCSPFFDKVSMNASVQDYSNPGRNKRADLCKRTLRPNMLELIRAANSDVVILAGNWLPTSQMWNAGYESVNRNPLQKKDLKESQMEGSIRKLRDMGKKAVLIGMVPGAHFNIRECLASTGPLAGLKQCPEASRFRKPFKGTDYQQTQMKNRGHIRSVFSLLMNSSSWLATAQEKKWLSFVDPYDSLCDEVKGECTISRNGEPIYTDEYHLTPNGTVLLKDAIHSAIKSLY